jgi:hypothetical protein
MRLDEVTAIVVHHIPVDRVLGHVIGEELLTEVLIIERLTSHHVLYERARLVHDLPG